MSMNQALPAGKLPMALLDRLLKRLPTRDPRVRVGPHVGEDAAVIDQGDRYLIAKTDPITFASDRIGRYLVDINANDVACMGAEPRWLLVTCLLPEGGMSPSEVEALFEDISSACCRLGISVCGGHTEVTLGLDRPILVGFLLGEVDKERFVDKRRIRHGDLLLLTKGIAIEGTCVIARECSGMLEKRVSAEALERAKGFLEEPGISVLRDARIAVEVGGSDVHGMHDPTEGGLSVGLRELAARAGVGLRIEGDAVRILPETRVVCETLGIDPVGLLASGALLIAVAPAGAWKVQEALEQAGIPCARIGHACSAQEGLVWVQGGSERSIPAYERDELVKAFGARREPGGAS